MRDSRRLGRGYNVQVLLPYSGDISLTNEEFQLTDNATVDLTYA